MFCSNYISIIVPCYNESKYIDKCLESLVNQNYPKDKFEIIVVDNNSKDDTLEIARTYPITCLELKKGNVGAVRNLGAKHANGNILAFIDGDCIAPENWLQSASKLLNNQENIAIGGGADLHKDANWIERYWLLKGYNGITLPKDLIGCSIIIPKHTFIEISGFDENITSGEDSKLSKTLKEKSIDVHIVEELNVTHLGNARTALQFISRQAWHAENYIRDVYRSAKDPIFYAAMFFLLAIIVFSYSIFFNRTILLSSLLVLIFIPLALSIKRIKRSKAITKNLKSLPLIFILDCLYLIGRSLGIIKGLLGFFK